MAGCMAHEREGYISTSGLKSEVAIVFLDPEFLEVAKISAIRVHLRQIYFYLIFAWVFMTSWPKMGVWGGQNRGRGGAILTPKKYDRESARRRTDTHTHRLTDANRFYNLSHAICYSYGTDNNHHHFI